MFPEEVDVSGTDRQGSPKQGTEIHMSRKGNDLVRRLLYTAAQCAVKWNPPVAALFQPVDGRQGRQAKEGLLQRGDRTLHGQTAPSSVRLVEEGLKTSIPNSNALSKRPSSRATRIRGAEASGSGRE